MADSPSINDGLKQDFKAVFAATPQQRTSEFERTQAVVLETFNAKIFNKAKTLSVEVQQVDERNADVEWKEAVYENRKYSVSRFVVALIIDKKDVREMVANPDGALMQMTNAAFKRNKDRVVSTAALADVLIGASDEVANTVTAANDGVITVDASAGMSYDIMRGIWREFINNSVVIDPLFGSNLTFAGTGQENYQLMGEDKFINNDYTMNRMVDKGGTIDNANGMAILTFPGNRTGSSVEVPFPILEEGATLRKCLALANGAISLCERIFDVRWYDDLQLKVASSGLKVVCEIGAVRNDGRLVQQVNTTI